MPVIDLYLERQDRNRDLVRAIMEHANKERLSTERVVELILGDTIGSTILDDEVEENLVISVAKTFGATTKNPQFDLNGGYEGNGGSDIDDDDDDDDDEEEDE